MQFSTFDGNEINALRIEKSARENNFFFFFYSSESSSLIVLRITNC